MANARMSAAWDIGATVWAILANAHRDPKKTPEPFSIASVHPYMGEEKTPKAELPGLDALKMLWGRR